MRHSTFSRIASTAATAILAVLGTTMAFAHGGDSTKIHGCVKQNGSLRVVRPQDTCAVGETAVDWNIQGPAGPIGPQGPAGPQGPEGPPGPPDPAVAEFVSRFGPSSYEGDQAGGAPCPTGGYIGSVHLFAGDFAPGGMAFAHGQEMLIGSNTKLFSILGTRFGGNGASTFALPDLRGLEPDGVNYVICLDGEYPER